MLDFPSLNPTPPSKRQVHHGLKWWIVSFVAIGLIHRCSLPTMASHRRLLSKKVPADSKGRILYIITSIHEYDTGGRFTVAGSDRFAKTILPVITEAVHSIHNAGYTVDVYLITQYRLSPSHREQLLRMLPASVGLQFWEDATPLGYVVEDSTDTIQLHTRGLSRQHRYVLKDKLLYYDFFLCFEDDMLLHGAHIDHYWNMTRTIARLRDAAPLTIEPQGSVAAALDHFYGPMSVPQLARTIPGWVRVEVTQPGVFVPSPLNPTFPQIPLDYEWNTTTGHLNQSLLDTSVCCHWTSLNNNVAPPSSHDIHFWEMSIEALGVRKMPPPLSWVMLLGGNNQEIFTDPNFIIGDYWSGRDGYFGTKERPDRKKGTYASNQGGWMATRQQIIEWHTQWCRGGLLPYVKHMS